MTTNIRYDQARSSERLPVGQIFNILLIASLLFALLPGCTSKSAICKPNNIYNVTYADTNPGVQEIMDSTPPNLSTICVIRESQFYACAMPMWIQIDGNEVTALGSHTHAVIQTAPGEHEITAQATSAWNYTTRSVPGRLRLEAYPGRTIFISGVFDEGSVALKTIPVDKAGKMLSGSRRILTLEQGAKPLKRR